MKNVAILGPVSTTDVWNIPISFYNHFKKMGFNTKLYNTLINDKFDETNLLRLIEEYNKGVFVPNIILHLDFGLFNSSFLKKEYIPTAKWVVESGDDPQNFNLNFSKIQRGNFDLILSPDIRCAEKYIKNNIKAVWCPHFADADQFDTKQEILFDAVTTRSIEEPFFAELKNKLGERFEARTEFLQGTEHSKHLLKGKIVVQNSKYKEITRRVFEGMMANRLVLTDRPDPLTRIDLIFEENKDIVYFDSLEDCISKINHYSSNDRERNFISQNGYNKTHKNHTTESRIKKLLAIL